MNNSDIRKIFFDFFRSHQHALVPSSSLIPANDPTLLFTNAGMVQFKSVFLGAEKRPYSRAVTIQKCIRAGGKHNDLENVGHTARHHTFFEMLGNFSFGDYFKRDAIMFAWELLTGHYKLPADKLWATIYEDDDEAASLWTELTGIPASRVVRLGAKDNFWQMGDTGPCGPCSEIIIDQGSGVGCGRPECAVGCDCDRFLEIWNLVFMQFERESSGKLLPLPKPSIDTGMGLERLCSVLQGKLNNFDTDLFAPIIDSICSLSQKTYHADPQTDIAIRVIADHIRSITFLLSDGLVPSNEGRGYVMRRIIRRASRYAKSLGIEEPLLFRLCDSVAVAMSETYPELGGNLDRVTKILRLEEERFNKTLEHGLVLLNTIVKNVRDSGGSSIPGENLFKLYDTYGFPLDIVRDVAAENGMTIDEDGFHQEMEAQKTKARMSWTGTEAVSPAYRDMSQLHPKTEFLGYDSFTTHAKVLAIIKAGAQVAEAAAGTECEVLLDKTSFYAESGGQVGDSGALEGEDLRASVTDTHKPIEGYHLHKLQITFGIIRTGMTVTCSVDQQRRSAIMRNHTATHMLQSALKKLLGDHVKQSGSLVAPDRFRFDFTHFDSLGIANIESIEDEINSGILRNIPVNTTVMDTQKAFESGATALFGEKYGDTVRVISIPDVSSEFCGGTHVHATGDIGLIKIVSEGSVASGIRRIEAITGTEAIRHYREGEHELRKIAEILKTSERLSDRLQKFVAETKDLQRDVEKFKGRAAAESSSKIIQKARSIRGVKVISHRFDSVELKDLRVIADNIRDSLGSGILVLASVIDDQAALVAMVTQDLTSTYSAGEILRQVAALAGGRGGGKPDTAQGGTKEIKKLDKALESLYDIIEKQP